MRLELNPTIHWLSSLNQRVFFVDSGLGINFGLWRKVQKNIAWEQGKCGSLCCICSSKGIWPPPPVQTDV